MLRVYNDRTHRLEAFNPQHAPDVTMYVCGPTVYNFIHLGNLRCFIAWDVVRRYLEHAGYRVKHAQNFTDVDDKIIRDAAIAGEPWDAFAERFIREFFVDADAFNIRRAHVYPKATEHIQDMVDHIEGLIAKGNAYAVDGDVYFAVDTFETYGCLSGRSLEQMQAGARVEVDERKRNPMDFALWKAAKPGEPAWNSPWGPGRPGWHIECSAMVRKHLGDTIDLHTGGLDLTFPHHENEIAQSEALTGHTFARYWLHNGFLTIDAEKMSKSLGNFATARDVQAAYDPQDVRFFMLGTHYRQELDFSDAAIRAAGTGLSRLRKTLSRHKDRLVAPTEAVTALQEHLTEAFRSAMDEDFNTSRALAVLFEGAKAIGELKGTDEAAAGHAVKTLFDLSDDVLGIDLSALPAERRDLSDLADALSALAAEFGVEGETLEQRLEALIARRASAKAAKEWAVADGIRNRLKDLGVTLMDRPGGETAWERAEALGVGG
ncbi:MAG TPA: cysteine--tRNA ligase [Pantanalinema sp.]